MTDGHPIPGRFCPTCGRPLVAIAMDAGFVEALCPVCDLGGKGE